MADERIFTPSPTNLFGDGDALLRIGHVVAERRGDLLAVDAAGRVDVLDRLIGAVLQLAPKAAFGPVIGPATPI